MRGVFYILLAIALGVLGDLLDKVNSEPAAAADSRVDFPDLHVYEVLTRVGHDLEAVFIDQELPVPNAPEAVQES